MPAHRAPPEGALLYCFLAFIYASPEGTGHTTDTNDIIVPPFPTWLLFSQDWTAGNWLADLDRPPSSQDVAMTGSTKHGCQIAIQPPSMAAIVPRNADSDDGAFEAWFPGTWRWLSLRLPARMTTVHGLHTSPDLIPLLVLLFFPSPSSLPRTYDWICRVLLICSRMLGAWRPPGWVEPEAGVGQDVGEKGRVGWTRCWADVCPHTSWGEPTICS